MARHSPPVPSAPSAAFFAGSGPLRALMRSKDWSSTLLGGPDRWPPTLRTVTGVVLSSRTPMLLWWGPDCVSIYNDACVDVLGGRHPGALGIPARDCWPALAALLQSLRPSPSDDWAEQLAQGLGGDDSGERRWIVSCQPVTDDSAQGALAGVLVTWHPAPRDAAPEPAGPFTDLALEGASDRWILLVEPDPQLAARATSALSTLGTVQVVADVHEALAWLSRHAAPAAVLVHDGAPAIRRLRGDPRARGVPFIHLASARVAEDVDDAIVLPVSARELALRVRAQLQLALQRHAHAARLEAARLQRELLVTLAEALMPLSDAGEVQATATRLTLDCLGVDRCYYCEIVDGHAVIRQDASRSAPSVRGRYPLESFPIFKAVVEAGRALVVDDVRRTDQVDEGLRRLCVEMGIISFLDVPVVRAGVARGILCITEREPRAWSAEEIAVAQLVAERTATAVEGARARALLTESETRYETLFHNLEVMVAVCTVQRDLAGQVTDATLKEANPAYLRAVGASSLDAIRGKPVVELLGATWTARHLPAVRRAMETGTVQTQEVFRAESERHYACSVVPLHGDSYLATAWDITAQKEVEEQLRLANARLGETDRQRGEFLAVLSHELRNPLAPIMNSLQVLERTPPDGPSALRARTVIARQVGQLASLVNDLLDVTRITRNRIELHRVRLDLGEVVHRAVEDNQSLFERVGVALELEPLSSPAPVLADPTRMVQVISNFLQNAAKFTPRGGHTRVQVSVEGEEAVIRVVDDGVGMSEQTQRHLFQPFAQAEQSLDRSSGGLGLGLALVKGLVELHGGSVSGHSPGLGRGTEMIARLPLDRSPVPAPAPAPGTVPHRRVLIIEDNTDAANSLADLLTLEGHEVMVASTGAEGLARARQFAPDVVLCDIGLPEMTGYDVARAFKSDRALQHTLLVAVSGYARPEDLQRAAAAGFQRHLAKPPTREKLWEILSEGSPASRGSA